MKTEILQRLQALGADISHVKGLSLLEDWQAIQFNCVLYGSSFADNLWGVDTYYLNNKHQYQMDKKNFCNDMLKHYYCDFEQAFGQTFYTNEILTPFKQGTFDYQEWHDWFIDEADLSEIKAVTGKEPKSFLQIFYSNGYPDHYYLSLDDPNLENPTVFGTDHEQHFIDISNEGSLEEFLHTFLTQDEFLTIVCGYLNSKD